MDNNDTRRKYFRKNLLSNQNKCEIYCKYGNHFETFISGI
jgi:hypothetical protein